MYLLKKKEINGKKKLVMSGWLTVLMLFLCSGFITLVCVYLQPESFLDAIRGFWQQKRLILLNWFPALVFLTAAFLVIGNLFYSCAVTGGVMSILSYVNLLKIEGREDPLVPSDITLLREALNAMEEYQLNLHWDKIAIIAILVIAAILLGIRIKNERPRWFVRILCLVLVLAVFLGAMKFVYRSNKLYKSFRVPYAYNIPSVFNTLGFNYCFLYNYELYPVDKPEDYSKAEVSSWDVEGETRPGCTPNVIMVMCEAFSDLSDEPVFQYEAGSDPLADYKKVAADENAVSGHLVVTNYGAGTANTEFNVLTGIQTNMIAEGTTSAFRVVRRQLRSVASVLTGEGYDTFFMHPGESWFYNRTSVYNHMGISDQIFNTAFDETDYKGTMISDAAFLDELKDDLQTRLVENDAPLFTYTVTIQNHQSYNYTKYPEKAPDVPVDADVTDPSMESLAVYMEGIRDSSSMLLGLTEYLDTLSEPTLLVFFGDHRPNLGTACTELGLTYNLNRTPEETVNTYCTPYVIWANDAYAAQEDLAQSFAALELPENGLISDNYLGAAVLELIGMGEKDAYFRELNELRRDLPVFRVREASYCLADGSFTDHVDADLQSRIDRLYSWKYYLLR